MKIASSHNGAHTFSYEKIYTFFKNIANNNSIKIINL